MKIYTRKGDDGSTGLYFGGRVAKNSPRPTAYGDVDEAQAAIGLARAALSSDGALDADALDALLISLERDLWVLMADLATEGENRSKLEAGSSAVSQEMVDGLEAAIDDLTERTTMPAEFVVPGENEVGARLDLARTVVRRAERSTLAVENHSPLVLAYLNRLSDLLWALARFVEHGSRLSRQPDQQKES